MLIITLCVIVNYLLIGGFVAYNTTSKLQEELELNIRDSDVPESTLELQSEYRTIVNYIGEENTHKLIFITIIILWLPIVLYRLINKLNAESE